VGRGLTSIADSPLCAGLLRALTCNLTGLDPSQKECSPPLRDKLRSLCGLLVLAGAACVEVGCAHGFELPVKSASGASPPGVADRDRDGLLDSEEEALAARFAPIVVLHRDDRNRPASVPWLLARSDPFAKLRRDSRSAARLARRSPPRSDAELQARSGSEISEEWTTYVHVYPRANGGINVQYWFFYPYNEGPLFFDHEIDWEHVTVRLSALREPERVDFARHEHDNPGVSYPWASARREAEHPIVLSALGSHASYQHSTEVTRFDSVAACDESLADCRHPIWRTWRAGGLENLGEPGRPLCLEAALSFPGRWGSGGIVPGTSAPHGPLHHRAYCVDAASGCDEESLAADEQQIASPRGPAIAN
jgi:hypothetical protein